MSLAIADSAGPFKSTCEMLFTHTSRSASATTT